MEILTEEELQDEDLLEKYWNTGELIINHDWPVLFKGAKKLLSGKTPKWDKLWTVESKKAIDGEDEINREE